MYCNHRYIAQEWRLDRFDLKHSNNYLDSLSIVESFKSEVISDRWLNISWVEDEVFRHKETKIQWKKTVFVWIRSIIAYWS